MQFDIHVIVYLSNFLYRITIRIFTCKNMYIPLCMMKTNDSVAEFDIITYVLSFCQFFMHCRINEIDLWVFFSSTLYNGFTNDIFRFLKFAAFAAIVIYVIIDVAIDHPRNLLSVAGLALYVIIFYLFSVNPAKVRVPLMNDNPFISNCFYNSRGHTHCILSTVRRIRIQQS